MNNLPIEVQKFLSSNNLATIATLSDESDYPYVLPVYYIVDENFNLYFGSHEVSKKLTNIKAHPHIGVSITDSEKLISLQIQGSATVAEQDPEVAQKIFAISDKMSQNSLPPLMQIGKGFMQVVTIKINGFKLADYSGKEPVFTEGKL